MPGICILELDLWRWTCEYMEQQPVILTLMIHGVYKLFNVAFSINVYKVYRVKMLDLLNNCMQLISSFVLQWIE